MGPKTQSKMFRKGKGKEKGKTNQGINIKINIGQPKRVSQRKPSQKKPPKQGYKPLPAFSAAPQGYAGGGVQGPAVIVAPMQQPIQQPDTTSQALTAYNNLLLQNQLQQNMWRNRGGLNIQPNFGGLMQSTAEQNLFNQYQVPYDYYRSSAGIVEEVVDDLTYDDPMTNGLTNNRLDYAPQLPDLTASASSSGMTLEEKQDNALSNLVYREQLSQKEKQVQNDLNNIDEEESAEGITTPTKAPKKKSNITVEEVDEELSPSTSSAKPKKAPKKSVEKITEQDKSFFEQVNNEVANIQNNAGKWFTTAKGTKLMYITEIPEGRVYNLASGRWISDKSPIYLNAVKTGNGDLFTTDLGKIHRIRKLGNE